MIAFLRGSVVGVGVGSLVVDLGSVGLAVQCTPATTAGVRVGERIELLTTMVVREDGWTLFGFLESDERDVFEQVQTVSGIGPRIALALLGTLSPDDLRRAVANSDEASLMKVSGIGRKGAQRLILELADRLGAPTGGPGAAGVTGARGAGWQESVTAGLMSLGWSAKEAESAVGALDPDVAARADAQGEDADVAALLKAALRGMSRS